MAVPNTDSCLNAIIQVIAQRGMPSTMMNNNGTNVKFVVAERELEESVAAWSKKTSRTSCLPRNKMEAQLNRSIHL